MHEKIAFEPLSQRQNVIHTVMWGLEAAARSQFVITSGGIEEWVAEDKHHFCIR